MFNSYSRHPEFIVINVYSHTAGGVAGSWCLRNVVLRVPEAAKTGGSLSLSCDFSLEQEQLYSVKFYQGDKEFYRYVPEESPPTRVFPIEGVTVDVSGLTRLSCMSFFCWIVICCIIFVLFLEHTIKYSTCFPAIKFKMIY